MWYEILPSLGIICGALWLAGKGLTAVEKFENGGKYGALPACLDRGHHLIELHRSFWVHFLAWSFNPATVFYHFYSFVFLSAALRADEICMKPRRVNVDPFDEKMMARDKRITGSSYKQQAL